MPVDACEHTQTHTHTHTHTQRTLTYSTGLKLLVTQTQDTADTNTQVNARDFIGLAKRVKESIEIKTNARREAEGGINPLDPLMPVFASAVDKIYELLDALDDENDAADAVKEEIAQRLQVSVDPLYARIRAHMGVCMRPYTR